jgi:arylsulfatase A-like enzyme
VALAVLGLDAGAARLLPERAARIVGWSVYALAVAWTAISVPIARVFSTPLTHQLMNGVGGALVESIILYLTPANIGSALALIAVAVLAPRLMRRPPWWLAAIALLLLIAGPLGVARLETLGLHRNAIACIVRTSLRRAPVVTPGHPMAGEGATTDLSHLAGKASDRDLLWISLESTPARALAQYGAPRDPMPRLSALARDALVFDSAYAAYPGSMKALYAMLCANEPIPFTVAADYAKRPCDAVAAQLSPSGRRTALFHSGRFNYLGMRHIVGERGFDTLWDADRGGGGEHAFGIDERTTVARLLEWVDALPTGQRYFAMYLPIAGHHPYHWPGGPQPFGTATPADRHANDLYRGDQAIGALVDGLRARGRLDRTLVIVHGDHGEAFGEHPGNFAHPLFLYDENVRVPLAIVAPGLISGVTRVPQVAAQIDFAPTLLALAGVPAPATWQGRSLLSPQARAARFFTDFGVPLRGLRDGRWKYIEDSETGRAKLFDVEADPNETRDLSAAEPDRARRYREHLSGGRE